MEKGPCQSPRHEPSCPCVTCRNRQCWKCPLMTNDHFTPKSVLKTLGIKDKPNNHQWLSRPCHIAKDRDTAKRAAILKEQLQGRAISFDQHRLLFDK